MFARRALAVAAALGLALGVLALVPGPATATIKGNNQNQQDQEGRDGHSRHEGVRLDYVPVVVDDHVSLRINTVIVIQTQFIHVSPTSPGVDYKNLDVVDVGNVPLLGGLFGDRLDADDFNQGNRVGSAFLAGANSLAAVIVDDVVVPDVRPTVVNGKGSYEIAGTPQLVETAPTDMGELVELPVIQNLMAGNLTAEQTMVIAGITATSVPDNADKVPFLGDIPVLQRLFLGSVHRGDDQELHILIRPSIVMGDDDGS
ncbi:hypothetical protein [Pelagibius sp.]|uniref:hypothetical protein n=1 Tax=Pelagibius sp. TaxID=1931238 RepID=UPI00261F081B|nr:hypothetical protein [Pelagibius sp.]